MVWGGLTPIQSPLAAPGPGQSPNRHEDIERVRLVWFGRTQGISGHVSRGHAHRTLFDHVGGTLAELTPVGEGPRVYAHAGMLLFREGGLTVPALRRFLAAGPFERTACADAHPLVVGRYELAFEVPAWPGSPVLGALTSGRTALDGAQNEVARACRLINRRGESLGLIEQAHVLPGTVIETDPYRWEVRFNFEAIARPTDGEPRRIFVVGRPLHEGARRAAVVDALRSPAPERTLVLGAGRDLERYSFVDTGKADRQRAHTWAAFRGFGLTALAPGSPELAFGLQYLADEAEAERVPVLAANLGGPDPPLAGWRLVRAGEAQVLLIGLAEPAMTAVSRIRSLGSRSLIEPAAAVVSARAAAVAALGREPDLVVVFGLLDPQAREQLTAEVGRDALADLLLTDFGDYAPDDAVIDARRGGRPTDERAPGAARRALIPCIAVGRNQLGVLDLTLTRTPPGARAPGEAEWRWTQATCRARSVTAEDLPSPHVAYAMHKTRQDTFGPAQVPLLPDLGPGIEADPALSAVFREAPNVRRALDAGGQVAGRITPTLWQTMVANIARDAVGAELALMPAVPYVWSLIGPTSLLEASVNLNVPDELAVVTLTAAQLRLLAARAGDPAYVLSGWEPAEGRVRGRLIDERERYRLLTVSALLDDPGLREALSGPTETRFEEASDRTLRASPRGEPALLREVVLAHLRAATADWDPEPALARMRPDPGRQDRWVVDVRQMSIETSNYAVYGPREPYAGIRETRVSTRENIALATRGELSVGHEGVALDWVNRARFEFAKAYYEEGDDQETADQLVLTSDLQAHSWALFATGHGEPFAVISFSTEFTPTINDATGEDNPRKRRLEGVLGLQWTREVLTRLRFGVSVGQDFAESDPNPQVGPYAEAQVLQPLGDLRLTFDGTARYYLPGVGIDTPTELGLIVTGRAGLDVPVFGGFAVGTFVDLYLYRGTVPELGTPGASLISGLALKYDRRYKPAYE